jgi:hypothetical protein
MLTNMTMCVTAHQESFPGFELDGITRDHRPQPLAEAGLP